MATMIPENVKRFTTEGESQFYRFLEAVAKPDSQYIVWYSPDIKGREPDFVLYSHLVGLIIFEVKDWALSQIREANPNSFILSIGSAIESRKNPYKQARDYFYEFRDKIKEDGKLISKIPKFLGKPVIPMDFGVIFTNIIRDEYTLNESPSAKTNSWPMRTRTVRSNSTCIQSWSNR